MLTSTLKTCPVLCWDSNHFLFVFVCQITAFDELQADFKVPIDQGNPLHAVGWTYLFILFAFIHFKTTFLKPYRTGHLFKNENKKNKKTAQISH